MAVTQRVSRPASVLAATVVAVVTLALVAPAVPAAASTSTSWTIVPSPNSSPTQNNYLNGVSCASARACTAVGYHTVSGGSQTLIEQWNGSTWTIVPSPNQAGFSANNLAAVSCSSPSNCVAVGNSAGGGGPPQNLIEQWNGSAWSIVPSPNVASSWNEGLNAVSCPSVSWCTAVGLYQPTNSTWATMVLQWNGSAWSIVPSLNVTGTSNNQFTDVS